MAECFRSLSQYDVVRFMIVGKNRYFQCRENANICLQTAASIYSSKSRFIPAQSYKECNSRGKVVIIDRQEQSLILRLLPRRGGRAFQGIVHGIILPAGARVANEGDLKADDQVMILSHKEIDLPALEIQVVNLRTNIVATIAVNHVLWFPTHEDVHGLLWTLLGNLRKQGVAGVIMDEKGCALRYDSMDGHSFNDQELLKTEMPKKVSRTVAGDYWQSWLENGPSRTSSVFNGIVRLRAPSQTDKVKDTTLRKRHHIEEDHLPIHGQDIPGIGLSLKRISRYNSLASASEQVVPIHFPRSSFADGTSLLQVVVSPTPPLLCSDRSLPCGLYPTSLQESRAIALVQACHADIAFLPGSATDSPSHPLWDTTRNVGEQSFLSFQQI